MKIGKRFNILFFAIASVCIAIPIVLFITYDRLNELQNLRARVLKTQAEYNMLAAYPSEILSNNFKLSELNSNWQMLVSETEKEIFEIEHKKDLAGVSPEVQNDIVQLKRLWLELSVNVNRLTASYIAIEKGNYDTILKATMEASGLQKAVELSEKKTRNVSLMVNASNIATYQGALFDGKKELQVLITKINNALLESIEGFTRLVKTLGLLAAIFSSLIVFIMISIATRGIIKKIYNLQSFAKGISNKDFSIRIHIN
ncbi:MAG TPA: hypothetical protein VFC68_06705, partial [Treponemataceae bacterium]|nr:hypothetical protein [Treponemataceae bacterium]